jgi:hypothetical protein
VVFGVLIAVFAIVALGLHNYLKLSNSRCSLEPYRHMSRKCLAVL